MDQEYLIKKATINDVGFLADVIIGAEKSFTNNLGLANFFELSEEKVKELIIAMLQEENKIDNFVSVNDLVCADGSSGGTEVIIKIPANYD